MSLSKPKLSIAVVTRETRLAGLRARFNNERQAKFYVQQAVKHDVQLRKKGGASEEELNEAADEAFEAYLDEDRAYRQAIQQVTRELDFGMPVRAVDRGFLPNFDFFTAAVVVVIGQDGLVANTAKYVGELPIVAVNPDPERIDGVLLPWGVRDAAKGVKRTLDGAAKTRPVTLAEASLNDGQRLLAFNDLFVGAQTHVSARYVLRSGEREESQSSSGVLVSTGAGSTGWVSSVFNMARAVTSFRGAPPPEGMRLPWEDRRLLWVVREPFASRRQRGRARGRPARRGHGAGARVPDAGGGRHLLGRGRVRRAAVQQRRHRPDPGQRAARQAGRPVSEIQRLAVFSARPRMPVSC